MIVDNWVELEDGMAAKDPEQIAPGVPLAQMIDTLRRELTLARAQGNEADIAFEVGDVELELQVAVESVAKGEGGVKFWVINAGGGFERSGTTTHNFKIHLSPIERRSNKRIRVSKKGKEPVSKG